MLRSRLLNFTKSSSEFILIPPAIGGYYGKKFEEATIQLFHGISNKEFIIYFSEVSETELSLAPQHIKEVKNKIPEVCLRLH